ncbi:transglycosylase domain-containing protein [Caproicibacterium sp. BJN0003]|uniref:transglycosylase domain-containing protein n=1 Tax=Caproicibacterium sp. BJN0003 TaxID=2994078 RepID=UPI002252D1D1|nr:transglycosylase domain-containing protein [Caproicibacterium sp. BJN0003]UZT81115.1 transglycosylase domain-containing protein [Caproicibacterium sp. BJN0003]
MKRPDTDQYVSAGNVDHTPAATAKSFGRIVLKALLTILTICLITGVILGIALFSFIMSMRNEKVDFDLTNLKLNYTSFIYVNGEGDNPNNPVELTTLYKNENRVWIDYGDIPDNMKNAMVAIEDKRFWEHSGVDWVRTAGAAVHLLQNDSYGGSTITQQLVKNITNYDEVSLTRKVKEIFRALNLEKQYSKEQILEAYLNYVSFGSGTQGVEAAAKLYFGKSIKDCDIAECASIAGITQNPSKYSPLINPENNKERQQTVLGAMHDQKLITDDEYTQAMQESENMHFVGYSAEGNNNQTWDWYTEALVGDVINMLMDKYNINYDTAVDKLYHGGYKIYSAENCDFQKSAEEYVLRDDLFGGDQQMQLGFYAMDYQGRVLATLGNRNKKEGNMVQSFATDTQRQSGSSIKPLSVYGPAMDQGVKYDNVPITYSTLINDKPLDNYFGPGQSGPNNADNTFHSWTPVQKALQWSYNASSAQVCNTMGPTTSYNFLVNQLHFTTLEQSDNNIAAMAVGGQTRGVTVKEMTAGFQIFGNNGKYFKPYTFYYVEDHDGNIIEDNRNESSEQVIKGTTAGIMNHILQSVVSGGTGTAAAISGWQVFGKTGTSNMGSATPDSWFIGGTPKVVAGIWSGYEQMKDISWKTEYCKQIWRALISQYLSGQTAVPFDLDPNIVERTYCKSSGLLAGDSCTDTAVGYYDKNNLPAVCNGGSDHKGSSETSSMISSSSSSSSSSSGSSSKTQTSSPQSSTSPNSGSSSHGQPPSSTPSRSSEVPSSSKTPTSSLSG